MDEDIFDELMKEFIEAIRRMRQMQRELEYYISGQDYLEDLYEERLKSISTNTEEPLVEVRDLGEELMIIVDISGVKPETLDVRVGSDKVEVRGFIDERKYEEAFSGWNVYIRKREYYGSYQLPSRIDPNSVRVERRGSLLVIWARKI